MGDSGRCARLHQLAAKNAAVGDGLFFLFLYENLFPVEIAYMGYYS
jgi:hypothetical protein